MVLVRALFLLVTARMKSLELQILEGKFRIVAISFLAYSAPSEWMLSSVQIAVSTYNPDSHLKSGATENISFRQPAALRHLANPRST
jgi:hypothetical protein